VAILIEVKLVQSQHAIHHWRKMTNRPKQKRTKPSKVTAAEHAVEITRWDQFIAAIGLALGVYAISYLFNTQDDLRFWLNQEGYAQSEFTVTDVKRVSSGDDIDTILVGNVARTNQEIEFCDWLIYEPRLERQADYPAWSDLGDRAKIGISFPIWFKNDKFRIYYVSEFPEKPTNAQALQCVLLNLTYFGLSFCCVAHGFRKAILLQRLDLQANTTTKSS
jgi:hypothetical protein